MKPAPYESLAGTVMAHAHELPDDDHKVLPALTIQHDGLTVRCRPSRIAAEHMAGKLYRAKLPKRDRRPTKGALTDTEIENRAARYAAFLHANGHTEVTLWPAPDSNCGVQRQFEYIFLARLTGTDIPPWSTPRDSRIADPQSQRAGLHDSLRRPGGSRAAMYILRHGNGLYLTRDLDTTPHRLSASIYAFTLDAFAIARRAHNRHGGIVTVLERRTDRVIGSVPEI